ncbi:MAG: hypothetical protein ACKO85_04305, partial [Isosphaeraceae bacterium]
MAMVMMLITITKPKAAFLTTPHLPKFQLDFNLKVRKTSYFPTFQASANSQINLSALQEIVNGGVAGTNSSYITITAITGGKIDLKNVTQISAGSSGNQWVKVTATDTNSLIDLSKLVDFQDPYGTDYSTLAVSNSARLLLAANGL